MTEQLREALDRIAAQGPRPTVAGGDLWRRGRRERRRARAATVAAVAAVAVLVLAVGGLGGLLSVDRTPDPAERQDGPGAVPSVLHLPPERLVRFVENETGEVVWDERVAETDLAVGRASVALQAGENGGPTLPVVVTAADGAYHPLVLPGWAGAGRVNGSFGGAGLALSPDGQSLAYAWWDPEAPLDAPMPAGVRVLDLVSGGLRTIPLEGGNGVVVRSLTWSPDSRWLLWRGDASRSWTPMSYGSGDHVAGRVAPGATTSEAVTVAAGRTAAMAIDDRGRVTTVRQGGRTSVWDGRVVAEATGRPVRGLTRLAAASPAGTSVMLGSVDEREDRGARAAFVDPLSGAVSARPLALDLGLYPDGAQVHPLGWLDDSHVAALVRPASTAAGDDRRGERDQELELVVMSAPSVARESWTYAIRGGVRGSEEEGYVDPSRFSVAVDLMSVQQPTRDLPWPEWPVSDEQLALRIGAAVAAVVAALLVVSGVLVRRRRRRPVHP